MHGTRLQTLRFAFHLDRIPVRDPRAGKRSVQPFRRRTRHSAAQPHAHQSSRPRLHSPPRLPRRNRRLRRSIEGRPQLPQPQSISRRHPRRSRRALHTRHRRHLRSHPHRLLPSHPLRRPPPPRRRLHQAPPRHLAFPRHLPPRRLIPPAGGSPLTTGYDLSGLVARTITGLASTETVHPASAALQPSISTFPCTTLNNLISSCYRLV